jgi:hypothetical protein
LDQLRAEGDAVHDGDLVHLSPARFEHLNPYGRYTFHVEEGWKRTQLRPLRASPPPVSEASGRKE